MMQANKEPMPARKLISAIVVFLMAGGLSSLVGKGTVQGMLAFGLLNALGLWLIFDAVVDSYRLYRRDRVRESAQINSGVHGRASFATLRECKAAGLTDPAGLFLGFFDKTPLFYTGKAHLLTVAPARQGKGINAVIPNLLHWRGSAFITDPKGELAGVTMKHRAEGLGQDVFVLNPWGLHGLPQHSFNPLQGLLTAASDEILIKDIADEAKTTALQLIPEPEDARNRFFREGSRRILRALMLHLATRKLPMTCTLTQMRSILSSTKRLEDTLIEMGGSTALHGTLGEQAEDLQAMMHDAPKEFADFREGAIQAVDIFDPVGWLGDSVARSDFEFSALKERPTSIYLVIPQDRIESHGAWLGLVARQAITAVARSKGETPTLFMFDEFANMGKLTGLAESLTALPGLGVRVWAFVQELADMRRVYGEETTKTLLSQAEVKQFFAVQSWDLAKELSEMLGQRTVKTRSFNLGKGDKDDVSPTIGEAAEPLMRADEIMQLPPDEQILQVRSQSVPLRPVKAKRVPFWEVMPWQNLASNNPVEGPAQRVRTKYRV